MQNESLLLDSTRLVGKTRNIAHGRSETTSAGVLKSCPEPAWFVLRATYSRELKIQEMLREKGVRTFVPMMWRKPTVAGKTEKKLVPAVSSLCFVYWDRESVDRFIRSFGDSRPVNYYWDRASEAPLKVPGKAMDDFIKVASTMGEDLIYLTEISEKLREGQTVKVKDGPFKGVEGKIVRIRKSRRILVEIPGMVAVATTYVLPEYLEIL